MGDMLGGSRKAAKTGNKGSGLSQATMTAMISADSSMDGDNLASLLRKLPGISLADGKLYANGQPVSKILLNGTAMFHSDMGAAMELVKSDEVRKVKVYDQYDQTRLWGGLSVKTILSTLHFPSITSIWAMTARTGLSS